MRTKNRILSSIDHLVYGVPDLESGMNRIAALFGRRPVYGGAHPGKGTHNALLALGPSCYLEIIAPDPAQAGLPKPLWIPVDKLEAPRLIRWAAKAAGLDSLVQEWRQQGLETGEVLAGSRSTPDGQLLQWKLTDPRVDPADGLFPFFIDWGNSPHPAKVLPAAGRLIALEARHPKPESVNRQLGLAGLRLNVAPGPAPALIATIEVRGQKVVLT